MEQPVVNICFLPLEILILIFSFLDKRTLVFNCRPVCKLWKEVLECSSMWKALIPREAKACSSELETILPKAHILYPWYICYVLCKNIFYKNLLPDYYSQENMNNRGDVIFRSTGRVISVPLQRGHIGYAEEGYRPVPQDIRDNDTTTCTLMYFGDCSVNQAIDLYRCGFTRKSFECCPSIHFSEWFAVGYDFSATCHLKISLFDSEWRRDDENGVFRYSKRLANRVWQKVTYTFTNYRPDVRYITLHHGVNTYVDSRSEGCREIVSFHGAAAKIAGAKLVITAPEFDAWSYEYQLL